MPDNLSELYTLQSRRLWLNRDDNEKVIGYNLLGGDFFEKVDAFIEPMTVWSKVKGNERAGEKFQPRRHDSSVQMWREFSYAFETAAGNHIPGVVLWTKYIKQMLPESRKLISFKIGRASCRERV